MSPCDSRKCRNRRFRSGLRFGVLVAALCAVLCTIGRNHAESEQPPRATAPQTLEELGEQLNPDAPIPPALNERAVKRATAGGLHYESRGVWGMSPHATPAQVRAALRQANVPAIAGPVQPTWQSVDDHYRPPAWLVDGKFGILIHFGLYSIPAVNEWYEKYMYSNSEIRGSHIARYGPLDKFGYKDFMPLFTLPRFNPDEWADVFQASGACWVMPTAEHHDNYSLWNSRVNPFNSVRTGPKRDVIGELAAAVRRRGLKFGVTNHTIEHYDFIEVNNIPTDVPTDLNAEGFEDFYWTDHSDARLIQHLANWSKKNIELIDQYHPDLMWFDNGLINRVFDPLKLSIAAYYFNRAQERHQDVTFTGKGTCFPAGAIQDFEDWQRVPRDATDFPWMVHDRLINTWGYTENAQIIPTGAVIRKLIEVVARNGLYALNVAPKGDGSIPDDQQQALREIGDWLRVNGEAIRGTHPWKLAYEGAPLRDSGAQYSAADVRFTAKDDCIYAFLMEWPADDRAVVTSLAASKWDGRIRKVELLGHDGELQFTRDSRALQVQLPTNKPCEHAYVLKISNPSTENTSRQE